jgi:hypothetical protein
MVTLPGFFVTTRTLGCAISPTEKVSVLGFVVGQTKKCQKMDGSTERTATVVSSGYRYRVLHKFDVFATCKKNSFDDRILRNLGFQCSRGHASTLLRVRNCRQAGRCVVSQTFVALGQSDSRV